MHDLESSKTTEKKLCLFQYVISLRFLMIENESGKLMISRYGLVETRVLLIPVGNALVSGVVEAMLWFRDQAKLPRTHTYIPAHCVADRTDVK